VGGAGARPEIEARCQQLRPDREGHVRLRSREATRTVGKTGQRRSDHQGRRRHRDRNQGAQGPR
jgi:hypothetical protein